MTQKNKLIAFVLCGIALLVLPLILQQFGNAWVRIVNIALLYTMLALGLNIVVGYAGLLDLGYVAFFAVGAYLYGLLASPHLTDNFAAIAAMFPGGLHLSVWLALPLALLLAAIAGVLLGIPVLKLRGDYLAIVTLGFGEIIRLLLVNMTWLTGGPDGISSIPKPSVFGLEMARNPSVEGGTTFHQFFGLEFQSIHMVIFVYLMALLLALVTLYISNRLIRMPIGRAWEALREDEIACRSLGLNPMKVKLSAFTLGAMFAGFGGAFFAARQGIVNPESFTFIESALILAIVVLGGMGSQLGVIFAAVVLTVLPELAREFSEYRMAVFGAVLVLMMMWRPQGLLPMKRHHVEVPT